MHTNRNIILPFVALLLVSSCINTYTGQGAATGAQFGAILGSAIGGLNSGPRGSDIGTIVGMAGGAIAGAAIGSAADRKVEARRNRIANNDRNNYDYNHDYNHDSNQQRYDDRIDFEDEKPYYAEHDRNAIEIRNLRVEDQNHDERLSGGEVCKVSFEIMNRSGHAVYDIIPEVTETTGNKHIYISPSITVESVNPHSGIRYTASVGADRRIKQGYIKLQISVKQRGQSLATTTKAIETLKQ